MTNEAIFNKSGFNKSGDGRVGPKEPITGRNAVCASQHPIVTQTMLKVMHDGGNAVDAAIAGGLVQATVQQDMTNHAGTVTLLYWEAESEQIYELNSMGTVANGIPPFRPIPRGKGFYTTAYDPPFAAIPGFMPGIKAMFERFATMRWEALCEPAMYWAEEGHEVDSFEHLVTAQTVEFFLHTRSGRSHFTPNGHLPQVGDRWPKPELARTLRSLAEEGPDYFITGGWAREFVRRANEMGWRIDATDMNAIPPRWGEGLRYGHGDYEIVQLSPPERQGVFCAVVLGILNNLDITSVGHYTESAEALLYIAHALRRADQECGVLNDPEIFENPTETLLDPQFHAFLARIIGGSKPFVDMTVHSELVRRGQPDEAMARTQPAGSCEICIVDTYGNWLQMMSTLQSGGIPGEVIGGVPMVGSHARTSLAAAIGGAWFSGKARMRNSIGNTFVFKSGKPIWSLGTPGNVHCTVPQVLTNRLDFGLAPYEAEDAPRMLPLTDDYRVPVESRISDEVIAGLARLGVLAYPLPRYDYQMGSFQMSWRDEQGYLHATAGPRRAGAAAGL